MYCSFVKFPVLFVCIYVLNNCHRLAIQLQLNISYNMRSVNKVLRLPAYHTIWQHCGLALHMKVR